MRKRSAAAERLKQPGWEVRKGCDSGAAMWGLQKIMLYLPIRTA